MTKRVFLVLLLMASSLAVKAGVRTIDPQSQPDMASAPGYFKPAYTLEQISGMNCPQGLERLVPGVYYYCVGLRELSKGNQFGGRSRLETAARWGSKPAQFLLGIGSYKGDSAPLNRPLGMAWLALAAERKDRLYVGVLKSALAQATEGEKQQADRLYREMLGTYGDAVAARRAELRYRNERRLIMQNEVYGARLCIAGLTPYPIDAARYQGGVGADASCPMAWTVAKQLDGYADDLLRGWGGHVTVGDLQEVPTPAR